MTIALHGVGVNRGGRWVLKDIELRLRAAQRWALVGGNGAGKTQLLKLIAADLWPTPTGRERRAYRLGGRQVETADAKRRIAYVGAERQDKYARYGWNPRVSDLVATGLLGTELLLEPVDGTARRKIRRTLADCGLQPLARTRFLALSYGQKRLALLARALVGDPDWLLLDEFYNGLDPHFRSRVDALLDAARRRGQSWIAAAHRAADVPRGTTRLMELKAGRLVHVGPLGALRSRLGSEAGEPSPGRRRRSQPVAARAQRAAPIQRAAPVQSAAPVQPAASGPVLLRVIRATLFVDYRCVLADLNFELRRGEHWAVTGDNGAGKSSLLKMLYGDLAPALGGRVERRGFPAGSPIESWKRRTGFVSPELQADHSVDVSIRDLVASGRHASIGLNDPPTPSDRRAADRWLSYFGLTSFAGRRPREVSYGQLRRALIARALAGNARMLLLDEPLTGLDPVQRAAMKRLLARLMPRVTMIIAVHHPEDLPRGMTHALHLHNRRAQPIDLQCAN